MMGKTKELSIDLRLRINNFHKLRNIHSTISNQLAIPRSMIHSVKKKFKQFGTTENLPGHGKKSNLSLRTAWKLCCKVNIKLRVVLKDITKSLDIMSISINTCTIQSCWNRNGLNGNPPRWTLFHKPCWFNFVKKFLDKENCFWEQVVWSGEIKIQLFQHKEVYKIQHKKSEAFLPKNTVPTLKYGGCLMVFWDCFSLRETGQLIAIRGIIKSEANIKVLDGLVWWVGFYGISTFVGYLTLNPFYVNNLFYLNNSV